MMDSDTRGEGRRVREEDASSRLEGSLIRKVGLAVLLEQHVEMSVRVSHPHEEWQLSFQMVFSRDQISFFSSRYKSSANMWVETKGVSYH